MSLKVCSFCHRELSLDYFHKDSSSSDNLYCYCKECVSLKNKKYTRNPEDSRKNHLKKTFNLTEKDYNNLLEKQHGVCAICGKPEISLYKGAIRNLAIDHNHKTGEIRGLLCRNCNLGVGYFNDNIETIEKVLQYLKRG